MDFQKIAEENKILEIRVGSHLFGTDTPDSDLDLVGIFMPCEEMVYGFQKCEEVDLSYVDKDDTGRNTKDAVDFKMQEYRKFVRLAIQNNPNILHHLFVNKKNIRYIDNWGANLLDHRFLFPHKGAHHRFVKYADSQRHKMVIKPQNYADLENGLGFLELFDSNRVMADVITEQNKLSENGAFKDPGKGKHVKCGDLNFERGVFVKKAKKMIKHRLDNATSRHVLFTKFGYDVKFASNLIQLLKEGIELMETGQIQFPLAYAGEILDIKKGKHSVEGILEWADGLVEDARKAYEITELPADPPTDKIEKFLVNEVRDYLFEQEFKGSDFYL
jgi:predicted nucleotidyltransferase